MTSKENNGRHPGYDLIFQHNIWSHKLLFEACQKLDNQQLHHTDAGTYGSIRDTLMHLVYAEERYLFVLRGWESEEDPISGETAVSDLLSRIMTAAKLLRQTAFEVDLEETVTFSNADQEDHVPKKLILLQAIHHAHEHRTHVTTLLGQLGIQPPLISGWDFFDKVLSNEI